MLKTMYIIFMRGLKMSEDKPKEKKIDHDKIKGGTRKWMTPEQAERQQAANKMNRNLKRFFAEKDEQKKNR